MFGLIFSVLLIASSSFADDNVRGLHCGTRGTMMGTIASDVLIPDYFPPENAVLRSIFQIPPSANLLNFCEQSIGRAHFGSSCELHDRCYGTIGKEKDHCDADLLNGWRKSCAETYRGLTGKMCKLACDGAATIMYHAMRYSVGNICPSCTAYDEAQKRARSNVVH